MFGVPVEASNRAQAPGDRGTGAAEVFQVSAEPFDVGAWHAEQRHLMFCAPADELPQVELVGLAGETAEASQEAQQCALLSRSEEVVGANRHNRRHRNQIHDTAQPRHQSGPS